MKNHNSYLDTLINGYSEQDNKTCYVLDTNFLLNALKSIKYADQYIEALEKNKKNIFIPFIVWIEFIHNLDNTIINNYNSFKGYIGKYNKEYEENVFLFSEEDIKIKIEKYFSKFNSVNFIKEEKEKVFLSINFQEDLDRINDKIQKSIEEWKKESQDLINKIDGYEEDTKKRINKLREMINNGDIYLGEEYTKEYIDAAINKSEIRLEQKLKPGNSSKDIKKEGFKVWKDISIPSKYGDIFLWLEVLEFVKENKEFNDIVIVSDDVNKGDWISKYTNDLYNTMKIEINNVSPSTIARHLRSSKFVEKFSSSDLTKEEIEEDSKLYSTDYSDENTIDYSDENTIVVPAKKQTFEEMFIGEDYWSSISILNERIPYIKYIAVYQTAPISAVTHYAKVKEIIDSDVDINKKVVIFEGKAIELENHIKIGLNPSLLQRSRYTKFDKLFESESLDELFE